MSKKVLITGSNGFLGSFIVEEALKQNYLIHAGVRKSSNLQYLTDPRINFLYYDFDNENNLREQLRSHRFDYIILNAGITNALNRETYFKVNSGYTRKFCKILIEENVIPEKLIFISSLASYGPAENQANQILDGQSVPHPATWYGESKLQAEQFIQSYNTIPSIIFRPTAVFGPRDTDMVAVYKTIKSGIEAKIGFGNQDQSFIYVKDLAHLIVNSLQVKAVNKGYFVSDGNIYPSKQLFDILKKILSKKTIKFTIPIPAMKVIAGISELVGKARGVTPLLNRNKVKEYFARSFAVDIDDLKKDFNFAPKYDLESGLQETIAWCKQQKLL
ncbi:MAG: NAD(P)-dependent oxidoreductase [Saprospiraceae bacterium]|nr:NAD(P)-dependent oxidoreductase [Bacteroidia bacterium]NNE14284.1 NAD(P)-dependent oxidoreductase [Saprospiraceae bacterium]NNL92961.1 NAD(P)-dependent oxidoreductase [Saprospiraceae bacterium]